MILAAQVSQVDMNTMISLGVLVVVIGAVAKISALLTKISLKLDDLSTIPARMAHIETHMGLFEDDMNNVFAAMRTGAENDPAVLMALTRRGKFRPFTPPKGDP